MKRNSKIFYIIIFILIISIATLTIVYAALQTQLNINFGYVNQDAYTWNVQFNTTASTASLSKYSTDQSYGFTCNAATLSANTITIDNTQLTKPDDYCVWGFKVENYGTMPAKLNSINPSTTGDSCTIDGVTITCGCVTFKLAKNADGTSLLDATSTLKSHNASDYTALQLYLRAYYNKSTASDVNSCTARTNTISYSLNWVTN